MYSLDSATVKSAQPICAAALDVRVRITLISNLASRKTDCSECVAIEHLFEYLRSHGEAGGIEERVRSEADAAAHILDGLAESRRAENRASAELIRGLYALGEFRLATEADIHSQGGEADVTLAQRAVECEASVTLALSRTATRERLIVGRELEERLPAILDAFRAGDLDYQRVRTIALVLSKASDNTVRGIEADVLASARRCSIRRLRERIWAHWFDYNEAEALAARRQQNRKNHAHRSSTAPTEWPLCSQR